MTVQTLCDKRDFSFPTLLESLNLTSNPDGAEGAILRDGIAYICQPTAARIQLMDITIKDDFVTLSTTSNLSLLAGISGVDVSDTYPDGKKYMFLSSESGNSITSWDVTDMTAPLFVGQTLIGASYEHIRFIRVGGTPYLVTTSSGGINSINTWDVTDPAVIDLKSTLILTGIPRVFDFSKETRIVVVISNLDSLTLVDFSDPESLSSISVRNNILIANPRYCEAFIAQDGEEYIAWIGRDMNASSSFGFEIVQDTGSGFTGIDDIQNDAFNTAFSFSFIGSNKFIVGISRANSKLFTIDISLPTNIKYVSSRNLTDISFVQSALISNFATRLANFNAVPAGTAAFDLPLQGITHQITGGTYSTATSLDGPSGTSVEQITESLIATQVPGSSVQVRLRSEPGSFLFIDNSGPSSNIGKLLSPSTGGFDISGVGHLDAATNGTAYKNNEAISQAFSIFTMGTRVFLTIKLYRQFKSYEYANADFPTANITQLTSSIIEAPMLMIGKKTISYDEEVNALVSSRNGRSSYVDQADELVVSARKRSDLTTRFTTDINEVTIPNNYTLCIDQAFDPGDLTIINEGNMSIKGWGFGSSRLENSSILPLFNFINPGTIDVNNASLGNSGTGQTIIVNNALITFNATSMDLDGVSEVIDFGSYTLLSYQSFTGTIDFTTVPTGLGVFNVRTSQLIPGATSSIIVRSGVTIPNFSGSSLLINQTAAGHGIELEDVTAKFNIGNLTDGYFFGASPIEGFSATSNEWDFLFVATNGISVSSSTKILLKAPGSGTVTIAAQNTWTPVNIGVPYAQGPGAQKFTLEDANEGVSRYNGTRPLNSGIQYELTVHSASGSPNISVGFQIEGVVESNTIKTFDSSAQDQLAFILVTPETLQPGDHSQIMIKNNDGTQNMVVTSPEYVIKK